MTTLPSYRSNIIIRPEATAFTKSKMSLNSSVLHKHELTKFGELYGSSPVMESLYEQLRKVAPTDAAVLIVGDSGTGKELVAHAIRAKSRRSDEPFIAVNCGAMAANLVEAELFGHERGSFTGATRTHRGCFERASGGTLFLDEITEMPTEMQVRLLRVLEIGRICRVGGEHEIPIDVRIIAATNRQPEAAIRQGKLREDLWFRLAAFPVGVPPLRDRGEDIPALAEHFLQEQNELGHTDKHFSAQALSRLCRHTWPGNVRELKNMVYRAYILADTVVDIDEANLTTGAASRACDGPLTFVVGTRLEDVEKRIILATLNHYRGSKKKAAEVLGVSLKTLYNRLNEYQSVSFDERAHDTARVLSMQ